MTDIFNTHDLPIFYTSQFVIIPSNTMVIYSENDTYNIKFIRTPDFSNIKILVSLNISHEPLPHRIFSILNKLLRNKQKLGLSSIYTLKIYITSIYLPSVQIRQALSQILVSLLYHNPQFDIEKFQNIVTITPHITS
jgi:hypothetical protein